MSSVFGSVKQSEMSSTVVLELPKCQMPCSTARLLIPICIPSGCCTQAFLSCSNRSCGSPILNWTKSIRRLVWLSLLLFSAMSDLLSEPQLYTCRGEAITKFPLRRFVVDLKMRINHDGHWP